MPKGTRDKSVAVTGVVSTPMGAGYESDMKDSKGNYRRLTTKRARQLIGDNGLSKHKKAVNAEIKAADKAGPKGKATSKVITTSGEDQDILDRMKAATKKGSATSRSNYE